MKNYAFRYGQLLGAGMMLRAQFMYYYRQVPSPIPKPLYDELERYFSAVDTIESAKTDEYPNMEEPRHE